MTVLNRLMKTTGGVVALLLWGAGLEVAQAETPASATIEPSSIAEVSVTAADLVVDQASDRDSISAGENHPAGVLAQTSPPAAPLTPERLPPLLGSERLEAQADPTVPLAQDEPTPDESTPEAASDEDEPLIRITVTGQILDQPVFTPFRREGTVRESSQPVYVIDRQQMEAQGARTVNEALRYLPGLLSESTSGGQLGAQSGQFMRGGSSSQTLILLDGRPLNEVGGFGSFDLSTLTVDAIEQIEVLPGGGSVLYGSSAIGGVINIITRRPGEETLETSASAAVGSFGFNNQILQARGSDGGTSWVLGYNRTASRNNFPFSLTTTNFEGVRTNADVLYNNLNFNATTEIGDRSRLRLGLLYLSKDLGVPGGVPVPGSSAGGFNSLSADDRSYTENWLLDLAYEADLGQGDDSLLTARLYGDLLGLTFNRPSPSFGDPSRDLVDQTSVGAQVQHNWQLAANQNLTYGVDFRQVNANNGTLNLLTNAVTENYVESLRQTGLFARYQAEITPRWSANAGIRQDFNDLANGSFTSFHLGTRAQVTDTTSLRVNFGRNFRVPTLADLFFTPFNNPNLRPESGWSFDVGVDQQLGDRGLARLTFFRNDIRDAINFDLATFTPQNIGRVQALGLEAELNYQLLDNVFAFANYTWNNPKILAGSNPSEVGNLLPFTSADAWNLGLAYETPQGFYTGLFVHSVSSVFVDRANQETLPGRTVVDLKLRSPIGNALVINASLNNLFNTQFEQFPGVPGLGRNVQLGVSSTF